MLTEPPEKGELEDPRRFAMAAASGNGTYV
jgi:hypothetical protein